MAGVRVTKGLLDEMSIELGREFGKDADGQRGRQRAF